VVKLVPVPTEVPPVIAVNQLSIPVEATAPNVTVPGPQIAAGVVDAIVGIGLTVATTAVLVAAVQPVELMGSA